MKKHFDVFIEISQGSNLVKYEHQNGMFRVTRIVDDVSDPLALSPGSLTYPANYGYIPNTIAGDRDEVDVFVLTPFPLIPGSIIKCRAIGMLDVEDQNGIDPKVLAVPASKVCHTFDGYRNYDDLPNFFLNTFIRFLESYKSTVPKCWSKVNGWRNNDKAYKEIEKGFANYLQEEQLRNLKG